MGMIHLHLDLIKHKNSITNIEKYIVDHLFYVYFQFSTISHLKEFSYILFIYFSVS